MMARSCIAWMYECDDPRLIENGYKLIAMRAGIDTGAHRNHLV